MKTEKETLIIEEGTVVNVYDRSQSLVGQTYSVIGRATKQFMSEISHESHRRGLFLTGSPVAEGFVVENTITGEKYITSAILKEIIDNEYVCKVGRLIISNCALVLKTLSEEADEYGNITTAEVQVGSALPSYVEVIKQDVKQYEAGAYPENSYSIYCSRVASSLFDRVYIDNGDDELHPLKVVSVDNMTFKGLSVLTAIIDGR